jgi:hypothetical protein
VSTRPAVRRANRSSVEKVSGSWDVMGCIMVRDIHGTIHIEGAHGRSSFLQNLWKDEKPLDDQPVAFCFHDDSGRCPGNEDVPMAQFGSMVRWVRDDHHLYSQVRLGDSNASD